MKKSLPVMGRLGPFQLWDNLRERFATVLFFLLFLYKIFIIKKNMAKGTKGGSSSPSRKISFGKKRSGVAKKGYSKYEQKPKKYQGQGR
jgi:hypothetical protein